MQNKLLSINNNTTKLRKIGYWITTIMVTAIFLITGIGNLLPFQHIASDMAQLGYPDYFMKILGTWKILGALSIVLPVKGRIREWAYAGMIFDLSGAAASRLLCGHAIPMVIIPMAIAGMVTMQYILRKRFRGI